MDNDAILMPQNDALAIEYQGSYRAARRDLHVAHLVDEPDVAPVLIAVADGSWLAVTPPSAPLRAGAFGPSEGDAIVALAAAIEGIQAALRGDLDTLVP